MYWHKFKVSLLHSGTIFKLSFKGISNPNIEELIPYHLPDHGTMSHKSEWCLLHGVFPFRFENLYIWVENSFSDIFHICHMSVKRLFMCVFFLHAESLQADVMKLQKENLLLEREKLNLQISFLKQRLAKLKLKEWRGRSQTLLLWLSCFSFPHHLCDLGCMLQMNKSRLHAHVIPFYCYLIK